MKNYHLVLFLTFIIFVIIFIKPAQADSANIKILGIQVQPSTIKINNTFSVSATILNNSTYPVYLTSGSCVPAFSVEFDSHSKQVYPDIACTLEAIEQRVDPNVETTISSVNKPGTIYKAIQAGTANANITIPYFIKNQTATDDSNIYYNTSKSFSFPILNQSETPHQHIYGGGGPVVTITLDPLEQFKSGISAKDVTCKEGLQLVIKAEDGSPACVKPDTAQTLIMRGWGTFTVPSIDNAYDQKMNGTLSGNVVRAGGPRSGPQVNYEVDVYASDGITIVGKTFSDTQGNYSILLPAGNYTIYAPDYPTKQTHHVSVISGKNTILNIAYGTGYK